MLVRKLPDSVRPLVLHSDSGGEAIHERAARDVVPIREMPRDRPHALIPQSWSRQRKLRSFRYGSSFLVDAWPVDYARCRNQARANERKQDTSADHHSIRDPECDERKHRNADSNRNPDRAMQGQILALISWRSSAQ